MIAATAAASIGAFLVALWLVRVLPAATGAVLVARRARDAMRDAEIDDMAREKAVQQASLQLFGRFLSILLRGAIAIAASLVPIWLANVTGLADSDQVIAFLARWDVIAVASIVITIGYYLRMRLWARN